MGRLENKNFNWLKRITGLSIFFLLFISQLTVSAQTPLRRPISPEQPMWLIHIDTWNYADPKKIIELIPEDIRPYVVMNISLSISHDVETSRFQVAEYGYEIAKSWVRTCSENQMWAVIQLSSGGYAQFSDFDLSVYEEFYQNYPNLIGFSYAEQFWGYDDPNDPLSAKWTDRMAHFSNMLELSNRYGGYLIVSMCWNQWGPSINPIGMLKRNPDFAKACEQYTQNYILCEKYTQQAYQSDMESICLGSYLSGYSGQYGCRYDDTGWTNINGEHEDFTMATAGAVHLEHIMLTGQTVLDGPELIWTQCFRETNRVPTTDGYTMRNWETFPQFDNVSVDIFRKIIDGTVRIPSRQEVIDRTKYVIINDVSSGTSDDIYSAPTSLFEGLYRMEGDGNLKDNKTFFKKTGRYPTIPVVYALNGTVANSFDYHINKSDYTTRWPTVSSKVSEFDSKFPSEYTGDLYAGRHENGWVTYNPYKTDQKATANIPFKYNTCESMDLSYSQYTAGVIKEYTDKLDIYLSNFDNELNTGLKTDVITINGSSTEPTFSYTDRADHQASNVTSDWSGGVFTLTVDHNGPIDITINCAGTATGRLTTYTTASIAEPAAPPVYKGPLQYESEHFDYKSIAGITTGGQYGDIRNYTGQGYLNFGTSASASVRDYVHVQNTGLYQLNIRYAVTSANISTIDLYVNGSKVATPTFTRTATLSDWAVKTQYVNLNAGVNTIELKANGSGSGAIYFDHLEIRPDACYTFTDDVAGSAASTPPAEFITIQSGTAGVVSYTDANGLTSNCLKTYSVGATNGTGVADLDRFQPYSDYSVTWKEYYGTDGGKKGVLLRATGDPGDCSYAEGMKTGYLFIALNNGDNTITLKPYVASDAGLQAQTSYTTSFTVGPNEPCWYRASAYGNTMKFECSKDSITWEGGTTATFTDDSYVAGYTQLIWGLNSNNYSWMMDNISILAGRLSVSESSVNGLYILKSTTTTSNTGSFDIEGISITDDVIITAPENFEVSTDATTGYTSSVTLQPVDGVISGTIYVRLDPISASGTFSGEIAVRSGGAPGKTVLVKGAVATIHKYDFFHDAATTMATNPPAINISSAAGNGATAGVVSYTDANNVTSNFFRAYSGGERNATGVVNLDLFSDNARDYSITWKQCLGSTGSDYKVGVILRGTDPAGTSSTGYVAGIMNGYLFIVYQAGSAGTPHSEFRIYKSTSSGLSLEKNNSVDALVPAAGQPVWYRASVSGVSPVEMTLEYSTDNSTWTTAATYSEGTATYPNGGSTQVVWGLAAANWDFYLDDIIYTGDEIPSITLSANALENLSYQEKTGGPSESSSFIVTGSLLNDDIVVTAPSDFEVSLNDVYASSLTISNSDPQVVYVRLVQGLAVGDYKGDLTVSSSGVADKIITLSGSVTNITGIDDLNDPTARVVAKEYYTLMGQKLTNWPNRRGLYIVVEYMSDNTVKSSKIYIR